MAFQFVPAGNYVKNSPIVWKFESHDTVYQSEQIRFERNVEFWRNKLGLRSTERVVTLNGDFQPIEYHNFEDIIEPEVAIEIQVESKNLEDDTNTNTIDADQLTVSESDAQPSLPQDSEDTIDRPKRKLRRKTS